MDIDHYSLLVPPGERGCLWQWCPPSVKVLVEEERPRHRLGPVAASHRDVFAWLSFDGGAVPKCWWSDWRPTTHTVAAGRWRAGTLVVVR